METGSRASYLGSTQGVACLAIEEGLAQAQALAVGSANAPSEASVKAI